MSHGSQSAMSSSVRHRDAHHIVYVAAAPPRAVSVQDRPSSNDDAFDSFTWSFHSCISTLLRRSTNRHPAGRAASFLSSPHHLRNAAAESLAWSRHPLPQSGLQLRRACIFGDPDGSFAIISVREFFVASSMTAGSTRRTGVETTAFSRNHLDQQQRFASAFHWTCAAARRFMPTNARPSSGGCFIVDHHDSRSMKANGNTTLTV